MKMRSDSILLRLIGVIPHTAAWKWHFLRFTSFPVLAVVLAFSCCGRSTGHDCWHCYRSVRRGSSERDPNRHQRRIRSSENDPNQ